MTKREVRTAIYNLYCKTAYEAETHLNNAKLIYDEDDGTKQSWYDCGRELGMSNSLFAMCDKLTDLIKELGLN